MPPGSPVNLRTGAISSLEMVNVIEEAATTINMSPPFRADITFLLVQAWVKNVTYTKNVFIDIHSFDNRGFLIGVATLPMKYMGPTDEKGNFFFLKGDSVK